MLTLTTTALGGGVLSVAFVGALGALGLTGRQHHHAINGVNSLFRLSRPCNKFLEGRFDEFQVFLWHGGKKPAACGTEKIQSDLQGLGHLWS